MAGITLVEQGDNIPLVLQIEDGNTGVFPQAVVTTDAGVIKLPINLIHVANGLYQAVWTMTDDPYVNVTYITYSDSYGGIESTVYGRDVDTFCLIIPSEYKANVSGLAPANEYDIILDDIKTATEIRQAAIAAVGATTTLFVTDLTETIDGFWGRGALVFTSGQCAGQMRKIHGYNGTTKQILLYTPLSYAPVDGDTFVIVAARNFRTNIDDNELIADTVWNEIESEHTVVDSFGKKVGRLTLDDDDNIHAVIKDAGTVPEDVWKEHTYDHTDPDTFGYTNQHQVPSEDINDYKDAMTEGELHTGLNSYANKNNYKADVSNLALEATSQDLKTDIEFLKDIGGGRWYIDTGAKQMIFCALDGSEVARFNLLDADGQPAIANVMERVPV